MGGFGNQRSPQEPAPSNNEDLELEKIVDDVDNKGSSNSSREISGTISGLQKINSKDIL